MIVLPLRNNEDVHAILRAIDEAKRTMLKTKKPCHVIIEHNTRLSDEQRRAYRMILDLIARTAVVDGKKFTDNSWDRTFARKFLGTEEGYEGPVPKSSSNLNLDEFGAYVRQIIAFCRKELSVQFEGLEL